MNPLYSIMESRYRWVILAGISLTAATVGAIMMLAWGWSHGLARLWFYAGALATAYFLVRAAMR